MHAIAAAVHASTPDHAQLAGCSKLAQLLPVLLLDVVRPTRYAVRFGAAKRKGYTMGAASQWDESVELEGKVASIDTLKELLRH